MVSMRVPSVARSHPGIGAVEVVQPLVLLVLVDVIDAPHILSPGLVVDAACGCGVGKSFARGQERVTVSRGDLGGDTYWLRDGDGGERGTA